jgi:hypothetical protein
MKSKLLQKISYGVSRSRQVVNGQQKNIERFVRAMAGAREPTWSSQSGDWGPGPQVLS